MTEIITYDVCATGSGGPDVKPIKKPEGDGERTIIEVPVQNLFPQQIIESASPGADRDITIFRSLDFFQPRALLDTTLSTAPFRKPTTSGVIIEALSDAEKSPQYNLDNIRYISGLINSPTNNNRVDIINHVNRDALNLRITTGDINPLDNPEITNVSKANYTKFGCPFVVIGQDSAPVGNKVTSTMNYIFSYPMLNGQEFVKNHFNSQQPAKDFAYSYLLSADSDVSFSYNRPLLEYRAFYREPLIPKSKEKYLDFTFQAPQPFFEDEVSNIATGNPIVANISTVISSDYLEDGSSIYGFRDSTQDELKKKNLYRLYREDNLTVSEICNNEAGNVLKFTSANVDEFSQIPDRFKSQFSKYVEISILAPNSKAHPVSEILSEYEMDKYILQMISDSDNFYAKQEQYSGGRASKEVFTDQFYDTDSFSVNSEEYYLQYAEPGENIDDIRQRIDSLLPNYNDSKFLENIKDEVWTKYKDSLEFLKFIIPADAEYTTRQGNIIPLRNLFGQNPGLYGASSVVNELEYPMGFYRDNPRMWQLDEIKYAICSAQLKNLIEPKGIRSYKDILSGEKAFSETIGYKVNKHEVINGVVQKEPVQQFYLMGHGNNNVINFCDTQVIFEKTYQYEVFSINFVVGSLCTRYPARVENFLNQDSRLIYEDKVESQQAWSIIEAPFFKKKVSIVDKPPLAPQATFLPYQGIDNRLRIMLQSNFGSVSEKPIKILDEDKEIIAKMRLSQPVNFATGEIQYSNDSLSSEYQSIRLDYAPSSLEDFSNSTHIRKYEVKGRTLIIEEDTFEPNKNYYYIFRAIDKRGISNPSIIYRFRLVSYANGIFMDVEEYNIRKLEMEEICFRELIQIEPSDIQNSVDFSKIDSVGTPEFFLSPPSLQNIKLGNDNNNPVWGRKFKMRITSKSSGRSIDVIFKFKQEKMHIDSDNVLRTPTGEELDECTEAQAIIQAQRLQEALAETERMGGTSESRRQAAEAARRYEEAQRARREREEQELEEQIRSGNSSPSRRRSALPINSQDDDSDSESSGSRSSGYINRNRL